MAGTCFAVRNRRDPNTWALRVGPPRSGIIPPDLWRGHWGRGFPAAKQPEVEDLNLIQSRPERPQLEMSLPRAGTNPHL